MPPVPGGGPTPGIRWLRRNVARFAEGDEHRRRRALTVELLADVSPGDLRTAAEQRTKEVRTTTDRTGIARTVPAEVLAAALHIPANDAVPALAAAYQPGTGPEGPADAAVAQLVDLLGGQTDEHTAARIALLAQAYEATARLVDNALRHEHDIAATLRSDPPIPATRRLDTTTEEVVPVDLTGQPFGRGAHECPGQEHAIAIAQGILDGLEARPTGSVQTTQRGDTR